MHGKFGRELSFVYVYKVSYRSTNEFLQLQCVFSEVGLQFSVNSIRIDRAKARTNLNRVIQHFTQSLHNAQGVLLCCRQLRCCASMWSARSPSFSSIGQKMTDCEPCA